MSVLTQDQVRSVVILLVEDNNTDAFLIQETLNHSKYPVHLGIVYNGEEALDYLRHEGRYPDTTIPDMILLDLNLPKMNGWEVLEVIKQDPQLSHIPVLLVTSSWKEEDERRAHELKADYYLVKPLDMLKFPMLLQAVQEVMKI